MSFSKGDNSGLISIFNKCVIPASEYEELQKKLTSKLLILSEDDIDDDLADKLFGKK